MRQERAAFCRPFVGILSFLKTRYPDVITEKSLVFLLREVYDSFD